MSTFHITQNQISTYAITGSHNTWILDKNVQISGTGIGLHETGSLSDNHYVIKGTISSPQIMTSAMLLAGENADVTIARSGQLNGRSGIVTGGDHAKIVNNGQIITDMEGVEIHGSKSSMINNGGMGSTSSTALSVMNVDRFSFTNNGEINGARAIYSEATHLNVMLGKDSYITTTGIAIETATTPVESAHIVNRGALSGNGNIFSVVMKGGEGNETVRNSGTINGSLSLGGSTDRYDGRGGHVTGIIDGGQGPDFYIIDNKKDYVLESSTDNSYDRLTVSFSFELGNGNHIEQLNLSGKGNFNLHGNDEDNGINGNSGNNKLFGEEGDDALIGGRGTDILSGGEGDDMFLFDANLDKEIVTDFVDGQDMLYFGAKLHDIASIKDLIAHHTHQDGADLVISGDGTEMIIRNFDRDDFSIADFVVS